jgi:hypothetical protein
METEPGRLPLAGLTVSHGSAGGVAAVKAADPAELFTDTVCAPGSAFPICQLNFSAEGETVMV